MPFCVGSIFCWLLKELFISLKVRAVYLKMGEKFMNIEEIISMTANVGFPVVLCFILLRYVLQTMAEKLDQLNDSLNKLNETIKEMNVKLENKSYNLIIADFI